MVGKGRSPDLARNAAPLFFDNHERRLAALSPGDVVRSHNFYHGGSSSSSTSHMVLLKVLSSTDSPLRSTLLGDCLESKISSLTYCENPCHLSPGEVEYDQLHFPPECSFDVIETQGLRELLPGKCIRLGDGIQVTTPKLPSHHQATIVSDFGSYG